MALSELWTSSTPPGTTPVSRASLAMRSAVACASGSRGRSGRDIDVRIGIGVSLALAELVELPE